MKKIIMSLCFILIIISLTACGTAPDDGNTDDSGTPAATPTPLPGDDTSKEPDDTQDPALTVKDYFPMTEGMEYIYEGLGNEYASYTRITDYIDEANSRFQTRTDNGGTETVRVIEIKDGKVSVIKLVNEAYDIDNLLTEEINGADAEVLLMEPLVKGTEWTLPDGRRRVISAVDAAIDTPAGSYQTIEVTTSSEDSTIREYYAPEVGLVKEIFVSGDMEVSSTLAEINDLQKLSPEEYSVGYFRTNGYVDGAEYPVVTVLRSREELDSYIEANRNTYQMDMDWGDSKSFLTSMEEYDSEFFTNNTLVLILLEESSGSIRHEVTNIRNSDKEWQIAVDRLIPQVGTDDMAEWHIAITLDRVLDEDDVFQVKFRNVTEEE